MIDYHIHTNHSVDAKGSIQDYCEQALHVGLSEICFTNHCELDPERKDNLIRFNGTMLPITQARIARLHDAIHEAACTYRSKGLIVKCGLEVGYFDGIESRLGAITRDLDFDFILGSIHCLNHVCIDSSKEYKEYFSKCSAERLLEEYYVAIEHLITSGLFDSVGHLDVYKKYGFGFYGESISHFSNPQVCKVFELIQKHDLAFEINTAGLRRVNEIYPAALIMDCAREVGVTKLTLGSDAHKPEDLGKGLAEGIAYARSFGFNTVYGFSGRTPQKIIL